MDRPETDCRDARSPGNFGASRLTYRINQSAILGHTNLRHSRSLFFVWFARLPLFSQTQSCRCAPADSLAGSALVPATHRFYQQ